MNRATITATVSTAVLLFAVAWAQQPSDGTTAPASSSPATAPAPKAGVMKVLFIGNSYTTYGEMPTMVELLSKAMDPQRPIKAELVALSGYTFEEHWNIRELARRKGITENVTLKAIQKGGWDVVVLQGYTDVVKQPEDFQKYGRLLAEEVRKAKARVVFYETWPHVKSTVPSPEAIAKYNAQYFSLAKATGGTVSPAGIAFEMVKTRKPELGTLIHYGKIDEHPSSVGTWLIACLHVATIYGKSPVGLPNELFRNETERKAGKPLVKVEPEVAKFLQEVAADAIEQARKTAATMPSDR